MRLVILSAVLALAACGGEATKAEPAPPVRNGPPVETRSANAPQFQPAFPGQTRAPGRKADVAFEVRTLAGGLVHPWGLDFLPDGRLLVTERPGRLRIVSAEGELSAPVEGLPEVDARGQGGLLDVEASPDFDTDGLIYWSYAEPRSGGNGTAVARGKLVIAPQPKVTGVEVIWRMKPTLDSDKHFGSRLVFSPDGKLFVTTGERSILAGRRQAQKLDATLGKVVRINPDGSIPDDNPFVGRQGALPEIWSIGHRNLQGAAINPSTGELWTVEHGPRGGDELNVVKAGKDYGWPTINYGEEYSGRPVGEGIATHEGMEQPLYYWDPVIAPSGMAFYDGEMFPAWRGSLFIGGMKPAHLDRLELDGYRVVGEERLLEDRGERIRAVEVGPDGALYLLTDEQNGKILKVVPPGG